MTTYGIAWLVVGVSAVAGAAILYWLMRNVGTPLLRALAVCLVATFFLVPAPVPGYTDQLAPAFVVCIFEMFFQIDGAPVVSFRILLFALILAALLTWIGHHFLMRRE